jgi:prepilin-type N-terminal cleavage/methylation domain-containing protein
LAYISASGFAQGADFWFDPPPIDGALGASRKWFWKFLWEVIIMTRTKNMKLKGFTLLELMVVIVIISVLMGILIPTISGFVKEARITAVVEDARTIKQSLEFSLLENLAITYEDNSATFNKVLYLDKNKKQTETVGAFTSYSWYSYKKNQKNKSKTSQADKTSQSVDEVIIGALDNTFTENWKPGKTGENPLKYNSTSNNLKQYLKKNETNFAIVVVYDTDGIIRLMQLYRKGVLVSYINGEYIVNTDPNAHFVGEKTWDTIYTDCGMDAPESLKEISLMRGQMKNGSKDHWY